MKIIDKIAQQHTPPQGNVLWDDGKNLKIKRNGVFENVGGAAAPSIETYVAPFDTEELDEVADINLSVEISVDLTELQSAIKNGKLILVPTRGGGFSVATGEYSSKKERYTLSTLNYDGSIYYAKWDEGIPTIKVVYKSNFVELGNSIGVLEQSLTFLEQRIARLEAK